MMHFFQQHIRPCYLRFSNKASTWVKKTWHQIHKQHPHLFLRTLIKNPRTTGAIWPSSPFLAKEIASHVPIDHEHYIVELGAGTGVVTEALIKQGVAIDKLIVIEYHPDFVKLLQNKFPNLHIIAGNAIELADLLRDLPLGVSTIVSSIPLRSLPKTISQKIVEQIYSLVPTGGYYIQFTYSFSADDLHPFTNRIYSKRIWLNIPPARVDIFQK